jgi:carbon-monoxide dehydrogenase medium subunit
VGDGPVRAAQAERALTGRTGTTEDLEAAAAALAGELDPPSDIHASSAYRLALAQVLLRRALLSALGRARAAS